SWSKVAPGRGDRELELLQRAFGVASLLEQLGVFRPAGHKLVGEAGLLEGGDGDRELAVGCAPLAHRLGGPADDFMRSGDTAVLMALFSEAERLQCTPTRPIGIASVQVELGEA